VFKVHWTQASDCGILQLGRKWAALKLDQWIYGQLLFHLMRSFVISGSHSGKIALFGVESGKQEQTLDTRGKFTLSVAYVSRELITCI